MTNQQYPGIFLYRRLVQAKLFIDRHYAENIKVSEIADEANLSLFHFIRQFKNIYRKTPHQYLIAVRIGKAKELLKAGKPVSEVCYAVGFESLGSFSGLFKRVERIPPLTYFKRQQQIKAEIKASPLSFIPACFAEKSGWF
jgi:AraC-like DNA-binding protein